MSETLVEHTYATYSQNTVERMASSSGGIFSLLARKILSDGGKVYGIAMSDDCRCARYIREENIEGLNILRGSKYLQAHTGDTFLRVKEDLVIGLKVLFSGTACQINGLRTFLKASNVNQNNLICMDVICHGVPSPALWEKYVKCQEKKQNGKLQVISFRCKDDSWEGFGMKEFFGDIPTDDLKTLYIPKDRDPYMQMFLRNYCLRPSCYECIAKNANMSDITVGDFWGINDIAPEMNDGKGTSLVLVRTKKGAEVFKRICEELRVKEVSYEDGVRNNPAEYRSAVRPSERDTFFSDMHNMSFDELAAKYAAPRKVPAITKAKGLIKSVVKRIIRGGGYSANSDYGLLFVFRVSDK